MYVMTIWIEICLLYVLTSQKTKTHKKKKFSAWMFMNSLRTV